MNEKQQKVLKSLEIVLLAGALLGGAKTMADAISSPPKDDTAPTSPLLLLLQHTQVPHDEIMAMVKRSATHPRMADLIQQVLYLVLEFAEKNCAPLPEADKAVATPTTTETMFHG